MAWGARNRLPWLLTGWLWFLGTLVPVIGLVQVGIQAFADRYTYLPSLGILVAVVWTAAALAGVEAPASGQPEPVPIGGPDKPATADDRPAGKRRSGLWRRRALGLLGLAALAALAVRTRAQLVWWESSEKLMRHAISVAGPSVLVYGGLAAELLKQGKLEEAAVQYRLGSELDGDIVPALIGLGNVYAAQGKTNQAEQLLRRALTLQPNAAAQFQLADFLQQQGRLEEARVHYLQGLALAPYEAGARNSLGNVYAKQQNWPAAREQFERALKLNPKAAAVHQNLGNLLAIQGRRDEAIAHFTQALQLNPAFADAHNSLGYALALQGRLDEAIPHYRAALASKPGFAEAHFNLGEALARRGDLPLAQAEFESALKYQTNYAQRTSAWPASSPPRNRTPTSSVICARPSASTRNGWGP